LSVSNRQGASATDWADGGTSNYAVTGNMTIQTGVGLFTSATQTISVTFPVAFAYTPVVLVSFGGYLLTTGSISGLPYGQVSGKPTATTFNMSISLSSLSGNYCVPWIAIGPTA